MSQDDTTRNTVIAPTGDEPVAPANELRFLVRNGSLAIELGYGTVSVRDGALAVSPSSELLIGNSMLRGHTIDDALTIRNGVLTAPSSHEQLLAQSGVLKSLTNVSAVTSPNDALAIPHASSPILAASSIYNRPLEGAFEIKSGVFNLTPDSSVLAVSSSLPGSQSVIGLSTKDYTLGTSPVPSLSYLGGSPVSVNPAKSLSTIPGGVSAAMPAIGSPITGSILNTYSPGGQFEIKRGVFTVTPAAASLGDNVLNAFPSENAFTIRDGAFVVTPITEPRAAAGTLVNPLAESVITIRNGTLATDPTSALISGEHSFLTLNAHQGTLGIRDDALKLTAEYTRNPQLAFKTQSVLSSVEWAHVGDGIRVDILDRARIQESFAEFSGSYVGLYVGTREAQPSISILPPSLATFPPIEYFHSASLLSQVTVHSGLNQRPAADIAPDKEMEAETHGALFAQLGGIDVGLKKMLQGAIQAMRSNNPDKVRHFSASLRELFTHVLHELSPDSEIKKWSTNKDHFANGKPTRRARLLYISRQINRDSFEKFVDADIKALLEFLDLFQGGTHDIRPEYTDLQLRAMLVRMEDALRFLIEISRA